jgi:hypothetical protein
MALRGMLVLLIGAAGLAMAAFWPMQRAGFGPFASAAPDGDFARSVFKSPADDDARMAALRRQAISALSQLRTGTNGERR